MSLINSAHLEKLDVLLLPKNELSSIPIAATEPTALRLKSLKVLDVSYNKKALQPRTGGQKLFNSTVVFGWSKQTILQGLSLDNFKRM